MPPDSLLSMCNRVDKRSGCVVYCRAVKNNYVVLVGLVTMFLVSSLVLPAAVAAVSGKDAITK